MPRRAKLYPGSDPRIFNFPRPWLDIVNDQDQGTELWIDSNSGAFIDYNHDIFKGIKKVCFYDFFHARFRLDDQRIYDIRQISKKYETVWYTANPLPVDGITTIRFDHMWNRTKAAYLDRQVGWKLYSDIRAYQQHPLHWNKRSHRYLGLCRTSFPQRNKLLQFLKSYDGFYSDVTNDTILPSDYGHDEKIIIGVTIPPARRFFDNSYISCQLESQYDGTNSVYYSEKTYDHLIQGRLVLNFGPPKFYASLKADGWKLPEGIDLGWDGIEDIDTRFDAYIDTLRNLFELPLEQLHELFLLNLSVIEHNYNMLRIKPYDSIV
jgi:hypothetical protein